MFAIPAIKALIKNALTLKSWKKGGVPSCPECQFPMVKRVAKKGRFVGQSFWGCCRYPKCSGKIHIG
ncbi:topoisomerase DNA-binding C4 zinc finger domain-containing protein [Alteromonas sp. C1M14]|nr:topoisomerase DNA-binding C4 zinc finger domain-containing protein [Alteromonas sp. C1M14]